MPCTDCGNNTPLYYTNPLKPCTVTTSDSTDAAKIVYTSAALACLGVEAGEKLDVILQKIDDVVCSTSAIAWNTFNYSCLTDGGHTVNSAQTFSERISTLYCSLSAAYNTFTTTTYVADLATINTAIGSINNPAFTDSCGALGVLHTDTLKQAITKIITNSCSVNTAINPSGANWSSCYTVSPAPTTITAGFNVLIGQICSLKSAVDGATLALPTFDNTGSCLASPGATDSLYATIVKIRTLLCTLPTFNINDINWTTCIPKSGTTLTDALNSMFTALQAAYTNRVITFDPTYFTVSNHTSGDACSGKNVTINPMVGVTDKLVALNSGDTAGYLLDKLSAGLGIAFDTSTTPGKIIVKNAGVNDTKVSASGSDSADYLINKIVGSADAASIFHITTPLNSDSDAIQVTPSVDYSSLAARVLSEISSSTSLTTLFNLLVCAAQPCASPAVSYGNISAVFQNNITSAIPVEFKFSQLSPTLAWYDIYSIIPASSSITTGSYTVSSASAPLTGVFMIKNNDSSAFNYAVIIKDSLGATLSGTSAPSGTLSAGGTLTVNPFTYGTSANDYVIHVTISPAS